MPISQIVTNSIANGAVVADDLAAGAALSNLGTSRLARANMPAGSVLQVVSTTKSDTFSTTSSSLIDVTGFSATITPTATSSRILVTGTVCWSVSDSVPYLAYFILVRGSTPISIADAAGIRARGTVGAQGIYNTDNNVFAPLNFLDSPSSTSPTTYKIQTAVEGGRTVWVNRGAESDGDQGITCRFVSTITLMEVAA